jgi:hypothetical protein
MGPESQPVALWQVLTCRCRPSVPQDLAMCWSLQLQCLPHLLTLANYSFKDRLFNEVCLVELAHT